MAEEQKVNAFYSMGKSGRYQDKTSGLNALSKNLQEQMAGYSEEMALAAAERRAARQEKRAAKKDEKAAEKRDEEKYGKNPDKPMGTPTAGQQEKIDANTEANRKRTEEMTIASPPPPPSAATMKSPIKSLYSAAFGSRYGGEGKMMNQEISGIASTLQKIQLDQKKALNDKVTAELDNFVPEAVDLQGFDAFGNGKNACSNFGMNLKQQMAQKKNEAYKLNPYSQEYKQVMADINSLVESSKNLTLEKTKLTNMKKEWSTSSIEDLYSEGSSKKSKNYLDQVHSGTAGMILDENGKAQFEVAVVDDSGEFVFAMDENNKPYQTTEFMSIDQMTEGVFEKVDASEDYRILQSEIRDNVRNDVAFDREGVAGYWNKKIAPKWKSGTQDKEILSWIHDNPEGGTQSYYDYFVEKYEIREGNESGMFTTEQLDEVFNYDTSDWDEVYGDTGTKLRDLIYNDLVAYNTNIVENYYSKQTRTKDKHNKGNNFNVGASLDPFAEYIEQPR